MKKKPHRKPSLLLKVHLAFSTQIPNAHAYVRKIRSLLNHHCPGMEVEFIPTSITVVVSGRIKTKHCLRVTKVGVHGVAEGMNLVFREVEFNLG